MTQNFVLDPMHIALEGIVPHELGCILYELVHVRGLLSLAKLNTCMQHVFDRNTADKNKRPPIIGHIEKPGGGLSPSMKAVQMFAFLKYLPLAVGKFVSNDDPHWLLLLHLCELVDLLFAPKFTVGMVAYLREFISDHLIEFKRLFGHQVNLRPKHHLLVHIPTVILKNGPLATMSCLRYELKNSFFKRSAGIVCNFINICKTLAYRHQCYAFYSRCSKDYLRMVVTAGSRTSECKAAIQYDFCQCVCDEIDITSSQEITVASHIHLASVAYKKGHFIVTGVGEDGNPMFGKIQAFVSVLDSTDWYAVVTRFTTDFYSCHYHVYQVHRMSPITYACISVQSLIDHNPLFGYILDTVTETLLIRLPYHIIV